MINADEIGVVCVAHQCDWTGDAMRSAYELIVRTWTDACVEPDMLGAKAPGVTSGKYGSFKQKRRHLEKNRFDDVERFELIRLADHGKFVSTEWAACASVARRWGRGSLGWIPAVLGNKASGFPGLFKSLTEIGGARYGYLFQQRMNLGPQFYAIGMGYGNVNHERHQEHGSNVSLWQPDRKDQATSLFLRDIYPQNFLNAEYLNAPIGRTAITLREWIEDDPDERGAIKPFTDTLTEWAPPVQNIPKIREALFRAGRVYYWKFFSPVYRENGQEKPQPLYRPDPRAPWEAPDPIPEIYRADYWKDKDPGLTY